MPNHKIIAAVSDKKVKQQLENSFNVERVFFFEEPGDILDKYQSSPPQILIIERELAKKDGIGILKQIKKAFPNIFSIVLSGSENTDHAVEAALFGADEYLHKILHLSQIKDIVTRILSAKSSAARKPLKKFFEIEDSEWLYGESPGIQTMFAQVQEALDKDLDILLVGEAGINSQSLAKLLHLNRQNTLTDYLKIDLTSFSKENTESFFWNMLQEVTKERKPPAALPVKTIYLEGIEALSPHFESSLFDFLKKKQNILSDSKIPRQIKIILKLGPEKLNALKQSGQFLFGFSIILLPPLRLRKDDLIPILNACLNKFGARYNKNISAISTEVLELFSNYSWPGNYQQLEKFVENAVLRTEEESTVLNIKDIPLDLKMIIVGAVRSIFRSEDFSLGLSQELFERFLLNILIKKFDADKTRLAAFLELPQAELDGKLGKYNL